MVLFFGYFCSVEITARNPKLKNFHIIISPLAVCNAKCVLRLLHDTEMYPFIYRALWLMIVTSCARDMALLCVTVSVRVVFFSSSSYSFSFCPVNSLELYYFLFRTQSPINVTKSVHEIILIGWRKENEWKKNTHTHQNLTTIEWRKPERDIERETVCASNKVCKNSSFQTPVSCPEETNQHFVGRLWKS